MAGSSIIAAAFIALLGIYSFRSHKSHWKLLFQSERYHGPPASNTSFVEGWYYKMVTSDERYTVAIVPGIFFGNTSEGDHHSFIFFNVFGPNISEDFYFRYNVSSLTSSPSIFNISIDNNYFSLDQVQLNLTDDKEGSNATVFGRIAFTNQIPWPSSLLFPSIMGPLQYLPFLNCYHGLLSITHDLSGSLQINEHHIDLTNGKGYIEKDYGTAFPSSWIWLQSNHFPEKDVSLFAAVADVPIISTINARLPMGIIAGIYVNKQLYQFTSYLLSTVDELILSDSILAFKLFSFRYRLTIRVNRLEVDASNILFGPCGNAMCKYVPEALNAKIYVELFDRWQQRVLYEGIGRNGGLEVVGDVQGNYEAYKRFGI